MKYSVVLFTIILSSITCWANMGVQGPYLGQPSPGMEAQIFAPDVFLSETGVDAPMLRPMWSPDGLEFYFRSSSIRYAYMQGLNGPWSEPVATNVADGISPAFKTLTWGMAPAISGDGRRIYFMVDGNSGPEIWVSERTGTSWSDPWNLQIPLPILELWCISATNDGTIYLTLGQESNNTYDIYRARPDENGIYPTVEKITSKLGVRSLFWQAIDPDERFLLVDQWNVSGGRGGHDVYVCFRDEQDQWTRPRNLSSKVNTAQDESEFSLTGDGKYLFFCRAPRIWVNPSNVYWIETRALLPDPNGPIHNLTTGRSFGSIQLAVDYAEAGDQIRIEPGIYTENIAINKNLILQSIDPNDPYTIGSTLIQGTADSPVITLAPTALSCELAGLTVRAGAIGISTDASNATIRNCRIMDNVTHGLELSRGSSPYLLHCLITANGQVGINMITDTRGRVATFCKPVIENCVIVQNGQDSLVGGEPVVVNSVLD